MNSVDLLIVGAGPTGIGAALRAQELGLSWMLVEAESEPGGMAKSITGPDGFTWDLGGHVLHSHFPSFDEAIEASGVEMTYPVRNGWIWMDGELVPTPIQQQLDELPTDLNPTAPADHLGDYYVNQFGSKLASSFFVPFQEKMWATDVTTVGHEWTSLRNGSSERNVPSIGVARGVTSKVAFPYPKGGTGQLWKAIAAKLDQNRVVYNSPIVDINKFERVAYTVNGSIGYEHMVSTMPLTRLSRMSGVCVWGAEGLHANEVYVIGLGMKGTPPDSLADKSWLYCPDENVAWHRATMLSNYDPSMAGEGRWNILFEIGRTEGNKGFRTVTDNQAYLDCIDFLFQQDAIHRTSEPSMFAMTVPMGYPVPTLGRDDVLRELDERLIRDRGIWSRGRFGGWRYESCNQDYSFEQGRQAVDSIQSGSPETAYWHPEEYS